MSELENIKKRVAVLPFKDIPNAYLCISGKKRKTEQYGERFYLGHREHKNEYIDNTFRVEPCITFLYDGGDCCAEWDGELGPIQLWYKCAADYKEGYDEARPHWFYDYAFGAGHWSQMAVDESELPRKFNLGDYEGIFAALKSWATRNKAEETAA